MDRIFEQGLIEKGGTKYGLVEVKAANFPAYNPAGAGGQLSGWMNITYK